MIKITPVHNNARDCGTCTKCCEGWLEATVLGQEIRQGSPCKFIVDNKCSIYQERPTDPCRTYRCEWLKTETFPEWFQPSLANIIITKRVPEDTTLTYYEVAECGTKIDSTVLNWLILWAVREQVNLIYSVGGENHCLGNERFYNEIVSRMA